jgi:3-hydroxyisobutyrate dehydrogenase-like beta-hydroxyacid dehydrogenase
VISKKPIIGVLMPGDMGHGIAKVLVENNFKVLTFLRGRSKRTLKLAKEARVINIDNFENFLKEVDIIFSIIPPEKAFQQAKLITSFSSHIQKKIIYVDCNAISPNTCLKIEKLFNNKHFEFLDGGIVGLNPIVEKGKTRLYISGKNTSKLEILNNKGIIVKSLGSEIGKASAFKMIYASATKGTFALHAATITAASKSKLFDEYVKELEFSKPEILKAMKNMTPKIPLDASRWEGEMYEIAKTFKTLNLTPKFHEGAADIMKLAQKTPISNETRQTYNESRTFEEAVNMFVKASKKN